MEDLVSINMHLIMEKKKFKVGQIFCSMVGTEANSSRTKAATRTKKKTKKRKKVLAANSLQNDNMQKFVCWPKPEPLKPTTAEPRH